jgi:hypothetical protein
MSKKPASNQCTFVAPDYEPEKTISDFCKLEDGDTKIRILTKPVMGLEGWAPTDSGDKFKPVRYRIKEKPPQKIVNTFKRKEIKEFWAMVVYNYNVEAIQVLQIKQKALINGILGYARTPEWGDPFSYDLKITRKGKDLKTTYTLAAIPHTELSEEIKKALSEKPYDLDLVFEGKNPFNLEGDDNGSANPFD